MSIISYEVGCRNCLNSDGIRHSYINDFELQQYKDKTEYEVMIEIERFRLDVGLKCQFCGSKNMEVNDIEVGGPLYDFNKLVSRSKITDEYMLLINIDKRGSELITERGGSRVLDDEFFAFALDKARNLVCSLSNEKFTPHSKGNLLICLTGVYDNHEANFNIQIERFRICGLTKAEILNSFKEIFESY